MHNSQLISLAGLNPSAAAVAGEPISLLGLKAARSCIVAAYDLAILAMAISSYILRHPLVIGISAFAYSRIFFVLRHLV
jgi:hypothetical protein